jgi:8-oxo-dGTP diphosphatase
MADAADAVRLLPVVAAALVRDDGRVLLARRPAGKPLAGLWEFPGGKVEPGETPENALARELHEELGIAIDAPEPLTFVSEPLGGRHLLLLLYVVRRWTGVPAPLAASELAWVAPGEMAALPMPRADRPLVDALARHLG